MSELKGVSGKLEEKNKLERVESGKLEVGSEFGR
jgi:hypothetical protein